LATLVIRNVEDSLHVQLKQLAALHGHSMEEEARCILRERLASPTTGASSDWVDAIRALFEPLGGLDLPEIEREPSGAPPDF
jgi:plasmid stability protein